MNSSPSQQVEQRFTMSPGAFDSVRAVAKVQPEEALKM